MPGKHTSAQIGKLAADPDQIEQIPFAIAKAPGHANREVRCRAIGGCGVPALDDAVEGVALGRSSYCPNQRSRICPLSAMRVLLILRAEEPVAELEPALLQELDRHALGMQKIALAALPHPRAREWDQLVVLGDGG